MHKEEREKDKNISWLIKWFNNHLKSEDFTIIYVTVINFLRVYYFNRDNSFNLGYEKDSMKNITRISPLEY